MGILDRLRRRLSGRDDVADRTFRVPPGFTIEVWAGAIDAPSYTRMDGGVWLVSSGPATDMNLETLRALFASVLEALARPPLPVRLAADATRLAELCRREPPRVEELMRVVVWTLQDGSLEGWADDPARLDEMLRGFELGSAVRQVVLASRADLDAAPWLFRLLRGLDIDVRELPADGKVLAEVRRPDGTIVSAVRGSRVALQAIDGARRHQLEQLVDRAVPRRPRGPLPRAPQLRSLIGAVADGKADARDQLHRYLLERQTPLLALVSPVGAGRVTAALHSGEHGAITFDVLPDLESVRQLTGGEPSDYLAQSPAETLALAKEAGLGLSLKMVRGEEVVRAVLGADVVHDLAGGRLPSPA